MNFNDDEYSAALESFVDEASNNIAFSLITSDDPELEREVIYQVGAVLAQLSDKYDQGGYGELPGALLIDDLAARALGIFKALGHDIDLA